MENPLFAMEAADCAGTAEAIRRVATERGAHVVAVVASAEGATLLMAIDGTVDVGELAAKLGRALGAVMRSCPTDVQRDVLATHARAMVQEAGS